MHVHFWKTTKLVWQGPSRQCFFEKQSMILRKVLFTLIDHKFMYEDSSVHQVNGEESNCKKIQFFFFILKSWQFALFSVCCNGVCKSGLSSTKTKFEWCTPTSHKGIWCGLFSLNSFSFCCTIYGTDVQIERTWKDPPRAYICCRTEIKTSLAFSLRKIVW